MVKKIISAAVISAMCAASAAVIDGSYRIENNIDKAREIVRELTDKYPLE